MKIQKSKFKNKNCKAKARTHCGIFKLKIIPLIYDI